MLILSPLKSPILFTVAFGASISFIAWLVGFEFGKRSRQFPYLKSSGLRISQSMGRKGEQQVYQTYDMTESVAKFTLEDIVSLSIEALETLVPENNEVQEQKNVDSIIWPGAWIFCTCDSYLKPIYLDLLGIIETLSFINGYIKDDEIRVRIRTAISRFSEEASKTWEKSYTK
jgi:hypothetical protein